MVPKGRDHAVREAVVCMVLTVWRTGKKAKLSTSAISMDHCCALRAVELKLQSREGDEVPKWMCNEKSKTWVLDPQACAAVLDVEASKDKADGCEVELTHESQVLTSDFEKVLASWPGNPGSSLYSSRKRKRGPKKAAEAEGEDAVEEKPGKKKAEKGKSKNKNKKNKKDKKDKKDGKKKHGKKGGEKTEKHKTVKAAHLKKKKIEIEMNPENFRKNKRGTQLIVQEMLKLKEMDAALHPKDPWFSHEGDLCLIKGQKFQGVPWKDFERFAPTMLVHKRLSPYTLRVCDKDLYFVGQK